MQYFIEQQEKAEELKMEIDETDKEIDQMVYELYGLTKEEIEIVEMQLNKVNYKNLNAKQKENYNFHKVAAALQNMVIIQCG